MIRKGTILFLTVIFMLYCAPCVYAQSETSIIYIQKDAVQIVLEMMTSMLMTMWKDIAALLAAFICTACMTILAINRQKRGK